MHVIGGTATVSIDALHSAPADRLSAMKLFRRIRARIFGDPVCRGCAIYEIDCTGACEKSAAGRRRDYVG